MTFMALPPNSWVDPAIPGPLDPCARRVVVPRSCGDGQICDGHRRNDRALSPAVLGLKGCASLAACSGTSVTVEEDSSAWAPAN